MISMKDKPENTCPMKMNHYESKTLDLIIMISLINTKVLCLCSDYQKLINEMAGVRYKT